MAEATVSAEGMSRREFLYYIWGASMALFAVQFGGLFIWYALPRFREGEFGGSFRVPVSAVPEKNAAPSNHPDGRFWLVNLDTSDPNVRMYLAPDETEMIVGLAALYKVCTHLGCIYPWNASNERFECPCHGSKYRLDGRRIESPAPRSLDRFSVSLADASGNILAESPITVVDGTDIYAAIPLEDYPDTSEILIDTGAKLDGPSQPLLCTFLDNCP